MATTPGALPKEQMSLRFQARLWAPSGDEVDLGTAASIASVLGAKDLRLETGQRLTAARGDQQPDLVRQLISSSTGWAISVGSESTDVSLHATAAGMGASLAEFMSRAAQILSIVAGEARASRLAAIHEFMLPEMSAEQMDTAARSLLRFPPMFQPAPWEWDWRCVATIERDFAAAREATNTIALIHRQSGFARLGAERFAFDRLRATLDINTKPDNLEPRFSEAQVAGFMNSAEGWMLQLEAVLRDFISGGA